MIISHLKKTPQNHSVGDTCFLAYFSLSWQKVENLVMYFLNQENNLNRKGSTGNYTLMRFSFNMFLCPQMQVLVHDGLFPAVFPPGKIQRCHLQIKPISIVTD